MLQFAWIVIPASTEWRKMYPFSDQLTTIPTYMDYFLRDVSYLIMIYLMAKFIPSMSKVLGIMFWLWFGYVVEYLLIYNEPFAYWGLLPISYSLFAGAFMLIITLIDVFKNDS